MNKTPGVDMTAGSLGQGFSCALGMAIAAHVDKLPSWIFTLCGDGEIQEGQIWEGIMFAAHQKLDNVIAFIDNNGMQIDGTTAEICDLGDIGAKFASFGWHAQTIDGHCVTAIREAIATAKSATGQPSVIVLNTVKGKGVPEFEGKVSSHSAAVTDEMVENAKQVYEKSKL
jgi:transketolase